jgi:hypothetical protein
VILVELCPSRSATIFVGTAIASAIVAWVCR